MKFKDPERFEKEWWELDPKLRLVLCDADFYLSTFGHELTITSLIRTDREQADLVSIGVARSTFSVHCFGRGADARVLDNANVNTLLDLYVNGKYAYDAKRPHLKTLLRHDGTAEHFHFQVMPTVVTS